jgi:hypothetical protein
LPILERNQGKRRGEDNCFGFVSSEASAAPVQITKQVQIDNTVIRLGLVPPVIRGMSLSNASNPVDATTALQGARPLLLSFFSSQRIVKGQLPDGAIASAPVTAL